MANPIDLIEQRQLRESPALQGGGHGARALPGDRGPAPPRPGLRGHRDQAPGRRRRARRSPSARTRSASASSARSRVHSPKIDKIEVQRDRRREPREALLPARQGGQEGPRPREAQPAPHRRRAVPPTAPRPAAPPRLAEEPVEAPAGEPRRSRGRVTSPCRRSARRADASAAPSVVGACDAAARSSSRSTGSSARGYVAGADEAGRGRARRAARRSAGVLFDYERLRDHARPAARAPERLEAGRRRRPARSSSAPSSRAPTRVVVRVIPPGVIDRDGLHRSNLRALREALAGLRRRRTSASSTASGSARSAPTHRAVVDGDDEERRDRRRVDRREGRPRPRMRAVDALYPAYGFASHVGYITPAPFSAVVRERGPCDPTAARSRRSATDAGRVELVAAEAWSAGAARGALVPPARLPHPRHERLARRATSSTSSCGAAGRSSSAR